ncbi:MAG: feruloyl-CoA synthase [Xanthobacteraceae bacterium]|nr:feruloyl-CoA synthase [Xanthobacteraceae bacterium]MCW5675861.1 feruloyl-CoA synthase [Xanthobacteraceae bacterium]
MNVQQAKPPFKAVNFAPVVVDRIDHADGSILLRSRAALPAYDPSLAALFRRAVEKAPSQLYLAERAGEDWRKITYEDARTIVDAIASALLERGLSAARPVVILSGNGIDHGLLTLACEHAGIPVAPISVAYSLQSADLAKIRYITELLNPGLVYAADTGPFAKALGIAGANAEIVASKNSANLENVTLFDQLAQTKPSATLEKAIGAITKDTIAKFLFTSGSTNLPKAVVSTHGMLTANQEMIVSCWPYLEENPLVLCDWLPWNHTFGGSFCFNLAQRLAGTMYIDGGKPAPGLAEITVKNITEVSPTTYFNVPAGYSAILPHLEKDEQFAKKFFSRLQMIFYAGASLPKDLWERLENLAIKATGARVPMTTAWGTTETSPLSLMQHFYADGPGVIGVPCLGVETKLVPSGNKLEIRVRGPNVTRHGYWKREDQTKANFDEDGFYKSGDAVRFADPNDPNKGLIFDGRLAEDFKLTSGTWVQVGTLRVALIAACSPVVQDMVICGEGRDHIGVLCWLNAAGAAKVAGVEPSSPLAELSRHPKVLEHVGQALKKWNAGQSGLSTKVARAILLPDAPSIDANEITDKGYINQRAALERRAAEIERLFAKSPDGAVIVAI